MGRRGKKQMKKYIKSSNVVWNKSFKIINTLHTINFYASKSLKIKKKKLKSGWKDQKKPHTLTSVTEIVTP